MTKNPQRAAECNPPRVPTRAMIGQTTFAYEAGHAPQGTPLRIASHSLVATHGMPSEPSS